MPFQIIRNDIAKVKADAIVNTANPDPLIGGGTDHAIYEAAGKDQLLAERKKIGKIEAGQAVYSPAFQLQARYIIHTVGPVWQGGQSSERKILHSCYRNSLLLAAQLRCQSIAFPLISTGVYGFPKDEALQIALDEFNRFLLRHDMWITLVVFDRKSFELSGKLNNAIRAYIDEHTVHAITQSEYEHPAESTRAHRISSLPDENMSVFGQTLSIQDLDQLVIEPEETFQQKLLELIDQSGMDDVTVYKRANIDRRLFSRIRSHADYTPKKKTAVALAIALKLDLPAMKDLLARAGLALSPSSTSDLIITWFVEHHNYDIYEINAVLFQYHEPLLGQ